MLKLLLMSVLLATFLVPVATASRGAPVKALRATLAGMALAALWYLFFLRFLYGRLA